MQVSNERWGDISNMLRWLQCGFLPPPLSPSETSESGDSLVLVSTPCDSQPQWQPQPARHLDESRPSSSSTTRHNAEKKRVEVVAMHGGGFGFALASDSRGDLYVWGDACQDYLLPSQPSSANGEEGAAGKVAGAAAHAHEELPLRARAEADHKEGEDDGSGLMLLMRAHRQDGKENDDTTVSIAVAAAGWAHVVGGTVGRGGVRCVGWNSHGQAPPQQKKQRRAPAPTTAAETAVTAAIVSGVPRVPSAPLLDVRSLAAGERHTLALCGDGRVWAWGDNSSGQLGVGTRGGGNGGGGGGDLKAASIRASSIPIALELPVASGPSSSSSSSPAVIAVAAGSRHRFTLNPKPETLNPKP